MNERIRLLAEQAGMTVDSDYSLYTKDFTTYGNFVEKFAQLIVQDCLDIVGCYTVRMGRPGEEYLHPITEIQKHFGVDA